MKKIVLIGIIALVALVLLPSAVTAATTTVTFMFSGNVEYYDTSTSSWVDFTEPTMAVPEGSINFRFGDGSHPWVEQTITVSGATMSKNVAYLRLKDHTGTPLTGGTARGGYGTAYGTWFVAGSTDVNGALVDIRASTPSPSQMSYEMKYNQVTNIKTQDVATNSFFDFQTILLTLRLETCPGVGLNGGSARYGMGATYTTWFFPGGATGSSAQGETAAEFFPGTYSFEMGYTGTANQKISVVILNANTMLTWQTTAVTLQYSGQISFLGPTGDSAWFNKPTMELLPGTYKFHFRTGYRMDLTISDCSMAKTLAVLRLKDHNGAPLAGGTARGGYATPTVWHVPGATDATGILLDLVDGTPSQLSYEMKVNNVVDVDGPQDPSVNSFFDFQTILLTLRLEKCCDGTPLDGGLARFGMGSTYTTWWFPDNPGQPTGTSAPGEVSAEFFPGTYSFEMQYQGTADQKMSQVIAGNTVLTWKTTKVTLYNSGQISYGGPVGDYYWFTSPMELLPGTVKFHFRDGGSGGVTDLTISGCEFKKLVNVLLLKDHNSDPLAGGKARGGFGTNHAGWWVSPPLTDAYGVLLDIRNAASQPTTMSYEMSYSNTPEKLTQDVSVNSLFVFETNLLTLRLQDCAGNPLDGGKPRFGLGSTYTTWWFPTNPGMLTGSSASGEVAGEVFPGTMSFDMQYQGTSEQKVSVGIPDADTTLVWTTTAVTPTHSGLISYGGPVGDSRWFQKPTMELLGGSYVFHFRNPGGGTTTLTWPPCTSCPCTFAYTWV